MVLRALLALALLAACSKKSPEGPPSVEPPADPPATTGPTSPMLVVHKALSVKDPAPDCAEVEALVEDPVPVLVELAEMNGMPPWAGMRAASCVILRHHEAESERLVAWVSSVELKGLGMLVLEHLDRLPEPQAVDLATRALAGPLAGMAEPRIEACTHEAVRAILDGETP